MKVYIVTRGEYGEGGQIILVTRDLEAAEKAQMAEKQSDSFMSCDWCSIEEHDV